MSPKRPPSIMGDDERAAIGREHRTPPTGIPVELDPELTPPPAQPPDITQLEGFDTISPPIRAALVELHNAQREQDVGLVRMWGARNLHDDVSKLNAAVEILTDRVEQAADLSVAVRMLTNQVQRVVAWIDAQSKRDDRLDKLLDALDKRLDTIERESSGLNATIIALGQRIDGGFSSAGRSLEMTNARVDSIDARLRQLESTAAKAGDVHALESAAAKGTDVAELEHRVVSLEDTRTRAWGAWWAVVGMAGIVAAVTAFIVHLVYKSG